MKLVIPGEAVPKGRPRFNRSTGTTYTPKTTRAYEQMIAMLAMSTRERFTGPVRVDVVYYTARKDPADGDNVLKAILDGLQSGQTFTNDQQVVSFSGERVYSKKPRVEITVEKCEEREEVQE